MTQALFWILVASVALSNVLLISSIAAPAWRFWPPPEGGAVRVRISELGGARMPLTTLGTFVLALLDWESLGTGSLVLRLLGAFAFAAGGAFALWGYLGLGPTASQGQYEGLVASGAYRWSRNPQYVGTILCMLGLATTCSSQLTFVVWGLWTAWFALAPFAEEPWMRERLGPAFDRYRQEVPRYFGWPRAQRA